MNTRSAIKNFIGPSALSVSFNQDASCFSVGLDSGFSVFDSDPCHMRVSRDFGAGISMVQMFGKSNFIGLVGGGKRPKFPQNKAVIWDDAKQKIAVQISAPSNILGIQISKKHIVVILQNSVRTYKFQNPPELRHTFETADNFLGLCCVDSKTLAFPGITPGQVQLVELSSGNVSIIPAHETSLRALVLSQDGQILATASETGTLIRVFATKNCARIAELRRGVDQAIIFSLAISPSGLLLAATSDKSTLHIFDIPNSSKPCLPEISGGNWGGTTNKNIAARVSSCDNENQKKWGVLGRIPMLPRLFSDVYSFASAQFEILDENTSCSSSNQVIVKSMKGMIGWSNDENIIVIGAGSDCRWEKFVIAKGQDGRRYCLRDGWKRYLIDSKATH